MLDDDLKERIAAVLKPALRDPSSFEPSDWQVAVSDEATFTVLVSFRARNKFGGLDATSAIAMVAKADCKIAITGPADSESTVWG